VRTAWSRRNEAAVPQKCVSSSLFPFFLSFFPRCIPHHSLLVLRRLVYHWAVPTIPLLHYSSPHKLLPSLLGPFPAHARSPSLPLYPSSYAFPPPSLSRPHHLASRFCACLPSLPLYPPLPPLLPPPSFTTRRSAPIAVAVTGARRGGGGEEERRRDVEWCCESRAKRRRRRRARLEDSGSACLRRCRRQGRCTPGARSRPDPAQ
jgi:hypothetical protein